MCLFPEENQQPVLGCNRFFRRKVTISLDVKQKHTFHRRNQRKKSLRSAHLSIIVLLEQKNRSTATTTLRGHFGSSCHFCSGRFDNLFRLTFGSVCVLVSSSVGTLVSCSSWVLRDRCVVDTYRVSMMSVTIGGGSFALCLFPSGQAYVTKNEGYCERVCAACLVALARCRASSSRLRRLCRCCPAALVCAFAARAVCCGLSVEFPVYYCVHNVDGNVVLIVFVFMMQGQGEAQFGLYPSRTRRHAHPVGLRHAPSFQQFGFRVLCESPGKLFSGSLIDQAGFVNSGMRGSGSEIDGLLSKFGTSPSGMVIDGIFEMCPSGMVLDGISADTFVFQDSEAAFVPRGCSSSVAASVLSGCSSSKVSSTGLGEVKEAKEVQFFVKYGNSVSSVAVGVLHLHADEFAVCGSRLMKMGCTLSQNGIGNGSNLQVLRRLRGGAGAYLDIPGQWECRVCHATRCWPARKRCHRCDAPRGTVPNSPPPWVRWGDRFLSRVARSSNSELRASSHSTAEQWYWKCALSGSWCWS